MVLSALIIGTAISLVDARFRRIPRILSVLALVVTFPFLSVSVATLGFYNYLLFLLLFILFRNGIGYGDVRLSFLMGVMLAVLQSETIGMREILIMDCLAFSLAALFNLVGMKSHRVRTPLAPAFFSSLLIVGVLINI